MLLNRLLESFKLDTFFNSKILNFLLISIILGFLYNFYLNYYFGIKPNTISKMNIILADSYKGTFSEKEYLQRIEDIYKVKEYDIDYNISSKVISDIEIFFDFQLQVRRILYTSDDLRISNFIAQNKAKIELFDLDFNDFKVLTKLNEADIIFFKNSVMKMLEKFYKDGLTEEDLPNVLSEINNYINSFIKQSRNKDALLAYKEIVILYLSRIIVPNKFVNISKTLEKHTQLLSKIPRFYSLSKGSVIVRKGQKIDEELFRIISETKTIDSYKNKFFINSVLFSLLVLVVIWLTFRIFPDDRYLGYIVISLFLLSIIFISLQKPFVYLVPFWSVFIFSFFVGGFVLAIFSFLWFLVFVNLINFQIYNNLVFFDLLLLFIFSFIFMGYYMLKYESDRISFFVNKLDWLFTVNILIFVLVVIGVFSFLRLVDNFFVYFSFMVVSIIFSLIISYFSVLFLGVGVGGISVSKIRWLLDLNNPILSDLSRLAPGTFAHSLKVSEIAEACAKAINVNPIIVKIGALYHDIGKMVKPKYFVENLIQGEENPHNNKHAYLSAAIIKSHVKKGLKIAEKYKLPDIIKEFIKTHHGTTTILYFFLKAKNDVLGGKYFEVREEDFKYPGPKPYTKEMVILMICDSVEAASRSLDNFSYSSIEKLTDNIIKRLMDEDQFSEVQLTFNELKTIKEVIVNSLYISYHTRIKYPSRN